MREEFCFTYLSREISVFLNMITQSSQQPLHVLLVFLCPVPVVRFILKYNVGDQQS